MVLSAGLGKLPCTSNEQLLLIVFSAFRQIEADSLLPGYSLDADFANSGCNAILGLGKLKLDKVKLGIENCDCLIKQ